MTVPTSRATQDLWTGLGPVPAEVQGFLDDAMLAALYADWVYKGWGLTKNIPANSGRTITVERPNPLTPSTTPLDEWEQEPGQQFSTSFVVATVGEYGTHVPFSRRADHLGLLRNLGGKIRDVLGPHKKDTFDLLTRDGLVGGASSFQTTGTLRSQVTNALTLANLQSMMDYLVGNNAQPITKRVDPSTGVGTRALNPGFLCFGHEDCYAIIKSVCGTDWLDAADYPAGTMRYPGEVGTWRARRNVRFILSTNGKIWEGAGAAVAATGLRSTGGQIDVYGLVMLSKDAYMDTTVSGRGPGVIVQPLGSSGSVDPFKKRGTIAWADYHATTIVDDARITRAEFGVAA